MIKKFSSFICEDNSEKILLYYAFDLDDNILMMPTVIHMDKLIDNEWVPTDVSTSEFALVRKDSNNWRLADNNGDKAFSEFRDSGPRGDSAFMEDIKKAIALNRFGPSWDDFIECLINGSIFAIITARGHEDHTMRKGVEWIIDNVLTEEQLYIMYNNLMKFSYIFKEGEEEYERILRNKPSENKLVCSYLDSCDFIGISAPSRGGNVSNPEKAKEVALLNFKEKINKFANNIGYKCMIGFSDDDLGNIKHVEELIDNISQEQFPSIVRYVVKGTTDPSNITKKVKVFEETANQTPGLESSIMPFTQFNNMTNKLYPKGPDNRQNDFANQSRRQSEFLAKTSEEIFGKKKRKKKNAKS